MVYLIDDAAKKPILKDMMGRQQRLDTSDKD